MASPTDQDEVLLQSDIEQEILEDEDVDKDGIPRSRPDPYMVLDFAAPDVSCQQAYMVIVSERSGFF